MKSFFRSSLVAAVTTTALLNAQTSQAQCSSDSCTTFDTWGDLVDHINIYNPTQVSTDDNNDRVICLCGREYSGDRCTSGSSNTDDIDDAGMVLHVNQPGATVAISCLGLAEQSCVFACPKAALVIHANTTLNLIGAQNNFVWTSNSSESVSSSKVTVQPEASLLMSGVNFRDIRTDNNNTTQNNARGGAIETYGRSTIIYDSNFENCQASEKGGAIYVGAGGDLDLRRGSFVGNEAPRGGAIYIDDGVVLARVLASSFSKNNATEVNATEDDDIYVHENSLDNIQFCANDDDDGEKEDLRCRASAAASRGFWVLLLSCGVWSIAML